MKLKLGRLILGGLLLSAVISSAWAFKIVIETPDNKTPPPPPPPVNVTFVIPPEFEALFPNTPSPNRPYFWVLNPDERMMMSRAIPGGYEANQPLYICQTLYNGSVHPGKVVAGRCNISYGGAEITRDNYRVLMGKDLEWRPVRHGRIPPNAVPGGFENGQPLFICHAQYGFQGVHPGKVVAGSCNIGYAGREIQLSEYQILVSR